MKSILIGDIGSTKAEWALLSADRELIFDTAGFNPVQHDPLLLQDMLLSVLGNCPADSRIQEIYYYGSGIISVEIQEMVKQACRALFNDVDINCESDMLGAARALSPGKEGVICILGTGSNSCLFDGTQIIKQIPSLGFPLGDEGSGADIGKACVRAFYYGLMPQEIRAEFARALPADRSVYLAEFRKHNAPNRFLATLVPIVAAQLDSTFMQSMLHERFRTFARLHITPYQASCPVHFTGSVAYVFREFLEHTLREEKLIPGNIHQGPLAGLIEFHHNNQA
jgi:N-acetylglucosamine kinase-like BadF-type ATPase